MTNDIFSIVIFNAILSLQGKELTASTPFAVIEQLLVLFAVSIMIGVFFGVVTCLMFKHMRFLNVSVINETFIMLSMALLSYYISTMTVVLGLEMSGIISLLVCGVV